MKKIKSLAIIMVIAVVLSVGGLGVQQAEAKTITITLTTNKPSTCTFSSAWERTRLVYIEGTTEFIAELCYGFDKVLVNEDYVWTRSVMYKHKSYLSNGNGTYTSSEKNASSSTSWAKVEKTHSGSNPTYGIQFTNATTDTTNSDFSLGDAKTSNNK